MNQDFVTQLQLQLREAALREERRTPAAQRFVRARRGLPGPAPLAAALAIALLALAVAIGALQLRGEPKPVAPKLLHNFKVSEGLSSIASGFGAVWVADPIKGQVLRIDPNTRRVTKRIAVGGEVQVTTGAGAVWALGGDLLTSGAQGSVDLVRIDPRTNRIVARIPMRSPAGENFSPLAVEPDGDWVWVCGAAGALRIDPDRNAADRFVSFHGQPVDSVARGERVWVLYPDGRLRELDARTGRTAAEVQLRNTGDAHLTPGRPGTLTLLARDKLTLIDHTNGRRLWSVRLGAPIRGWTEQGDSLWALASHAPEGRDELVRVDADTGRRTGRVFLPEPDAAALTSRGDEVWAAAAGGSVLVVR